MPTNNLHSSTKLKTTVQTELMPHVILVLLIIFGHFINFLSVFPATIKKLPGGLYYLVKKTVCGLRFIADRITSTISELSSDNL